MNRYLFTLALILAVGIVSAETTPPLVGMNRAKALALYAPPPDYPVEARSRYMTGHGIAVLQINQKTGEVIAAQMEKSTGHAMLDHAALAAFSRWRFKPGTVKRVRIPIRYTIGGKT